MGIRLSHEEFARLVREALEDIPAPLAEYLGELAVDIEAAPDARTLDEAGVDDPRELLGFYRGTPLTLRGFEDHARLPDRITLYQRNIERVCRNREDIVREIRKTVFHEVGHHFGLDEDDLAELGYE